MVEFLIVLPVLLLLVFGTLQFALIYYGKITLNYAAFEAARAGSLANADIEAIENGFVRGMLPAHTYVQDIRNSGMTARVNAVFGAKQRLHDEVDNGYVQIRIINPSPASFLAHGLLIAGVRTIPNDNLSYRDARSVGISNQSVQDANLLKVHISYCYELLVPVANRVLKSIMGGFPPNPNPGLFDVTPAAPLWTAQVGTFAQRCIDDNVRTNPSIPIFAQALVRMQSDPVQGAFCAGCP
jgi:hypothetical protein